jgi:hypothetical protein
MIDHDRLRISKFRYFFFNLIFSQVNLDKFILIK